MKIYVDMDGVLANFEKRYIELFRESPDSNCSRDRKEFSKNWDVFVGGKHFETLDLWPGGSELITYLSKNVPLEDVEILTSSGGNKYHDLVEIQKNNWIKTFNLPEWKVNVVAGRKRKAEFATPDSILIDDTLDVIQAFRHAGGIGIHHKDINNTLMLLDIHLTKD